MGSLKMHRISCLLLTWISIVIIPGLWGSSYFESQLFDKKSRKMLLIVLSNHHKYCYLLEILFWFETWQFHKFTVLEVVITSVPAVSRFFRNFLSREKAWRKRSFWVSKTRALQVIVPLCIHLKYLHWYKSYF